MAAESPRASLLAAGRGRRRTRPTSTPTSRGGSSSSWLNQVERWFRDFTDKNPRRGIFGSVPDLIASIDKYMAAANNNPKPYIWTATAESILATIQ